MLRLYFLTSKIPESKKICDNLALEQNQVVRLMRLFALEPSVIDKNDKIVSQISINAPIE